MESIEADGRPPHFGGCIAFNSSHPANAFLPQFTFNQHVTNNRLTDHPAIVPPARRTVPRFANSWKTYRRFNVINLKSALKKPFSCLRMRRSVTAVVVLACLAALSPPRAHGQDFRQYRDYDRYRYLPRIPEGPEVPPPLTLEEAELTGDPTVLVEALKGIIFVDDPSKVVERPTGEGVQVLSDYALLNSPGLRNIAGAYLGRPISIRRLNELVRDVIRFYRNNDQPVVNVTVPADQDITDGIVQVVVTEGRVGNIIVRGSNYFDPQMLADQLWLQPGGWINESDLQEEMKWLIRNPFRRVDLELTPGTYPGETDVVFNVQDKLPMRVYAGYEDTGQRTNGLERTFYGVNWYNAFHRDDQTGYQYTASSDFNKVGAHSAFYSKALGNRDILTLYGSYVDFNAPIPGFFFDNEGSIWQLLSRWYRELCPIGTYEHGITAGFDYKRIDTALVLGGIPFSVSQADVAQFMVGYNGKRYDDFGSIHVGIDGYFSPGHLSGRNNSTDFRSVRSLASASYAYTRGFVERRIDLPHNLEFVGRFTGQLAEGNLLPTEQLGLGGYNSVRGFDMYSALGDSGYFVNLELQTQPIHLGCGEKLGIGDEFGISQDALRFLAFYDFGDAYSHTLAFAGEDPSVDLQGVGVGLRYNLERRFSLRADYAWQVNRLASQPAPNQRWHIGVVTSY